MVSTLSAKFHRLLRWSEQYIKTDMTYLARGGFWLVLGQIVSFAAAFGLSLAFGNLVPKEVFGNYKFILSLAGIFSTVALTALPIAVTQAVARGHDGALEAGFRTSLRWSIPSVIATIGGSLYYFVQGNSMIGYSLLVVAGTAPLVAAFNLYAAFLQGKKDFRRSTLYNLFVSTIPPLTLLALILLGVGTSVVALITAFYISTIVLSVYFHYQTIKVYRPHGGADPETTPYGMHLSLMNVLGRIASYIDKVLVFHYLGAAPLAVYSFAVAPSQYVLRLNSVFKALALPKLSERDILTLKATLPRKIGFHFLAALTATIGYILLVPYFFTFLFPQYIESIPYAQVMGLTILSAPGVWLGQTLLAHMRKRELYIINTISPLIKIGLFLTLIPTFGIWGVVYATLASGFFGFLLSYWVFKHL